MNIQIFCLLILFTHWISQDYCKCLPVPVNTKAVLGRDQATITEKKPIKAIRGTIVADGTGEKLAGVIVELLSDTKESREMRRNQKPGFTQNQATVAICQTNKEGNFCFKNIPSGRYELRCSNKSPGWDGTSIFLIVNSNLKRKDHNLKVHLRAAT